MTIEKFFKNTNLDKTFLIGYYGGGNFGDELLLEILLNFFDKKDVKDLIIYYQNPNLYNTYHRDFNNKVIDGRNKKLLITSLIKSKNIIFGGGGIWGVDFSKNVFYLSILVFLAKIILNKKVYPIGVGFYNSTTTLGKISAFLIAKSSNFIIARDEESYENFKRFSDSTYLDKDLSFWTENFSKSYDSGKLASLKREKGKFLFITLRRFQKKLSNNYLSTIKNLINDNSKRKIILSLLEPFEVDPDGADFINNVAKKNKNITSIDFSYNPVSLFKFFQSNNKNILVISPQYHGQIMAFLAKAKFFPLAYDNKNIEFHKLAHLAKTYDINNLTQNDIEDFIRINS